MLVQDRIEQNNWLCLFGNIDNYAHQKVRMIVSGYFFL